MTIRYHSGIEVSRIIGNRYVHKLYIGYTKREAIALFKREVKHKKDAELFVGE